MKKTLAILIVLCLAVSMTFAFDFRELDYETYVGFSMSQYSAEGFKDTVLWGEDISLKDANGSKMAFGVKLGGRAALIEHAYAIVDADVNFSSLQTYVIDAGIGGAYYFIDNTFHLGVGAKVGFFSLVNLIGTMNYDYHGKDKSGEYFYGDKGDAVTYEVMGISLRPFVDFSYDLNDIFSVGASVGYRIGFSFKDAVYVAKHDIGTFGDQEPKVSPNGLTASIYGVYKF